MDLISTFSRSGLTNVCLFFLTPISSLTDIISYRVLNLYWKSSQHGGEVVLSFRQGEDDDIDDKLG